MVRALLTPRRQQPPRLQRLRRTAVDAPGLCSPCSARTAVRPGSTSPPGCRTRHWRRFHRPSRGPARPRPRLHHDHRAGAAEGAPRPRRPYDGRPGVRWVPSPGAGGLLHRPGLRADRRRTARRRRAGAASSVAAGPAAWRCSGPGNAPCGRRPGQTRRSRALQPSATSASSWTAISSSLPGPRDRVTDRPGASARAAGSRQTVCCTGSVPGRPPHAGILAGARNAVEVRGRAQTT